MGFDGYIVSDCGAIEDIFNDHKIVNTPEEAAALAVKSGCDLNCGLGEAIFPYLTKSVEKGLIDEAQIDKSVKRLFTARFKLGMFDPPEMVPFAQIPYDIVDCKEHQQMALDATHKSIVLLKNDNNILPLSKDIKKVAVIGPNSNQWLMLLGNYNGVPSNPVTPLQGIKDKLPNAEVHFAQGCELAEGMPMFYTIPSKVLFTNDGENGVAATYFNNKDREGEPLFSEVINELNANWYDQAPRDDMDDDNFGVIWNTELIPDQTGSYQLGFISTCNTKLYLNDSLITKTSYHFRDEYGDPRLNKSNTMQLQAGKKYTLRVEAGESYADAQVQLIWAAPKRNLKKEAVKLARQSDVIIMCMGLTARMEGEEMDIEIDGFRGGDRTKLGLPATQVDLIREINSLGKPVILVLLNGSALAINWEFENMSAIVEAWYPGQAAGAAIADVLFGDYNPAGRLPVTFYKDVNDLPDFEDYHMADGFTYRYFKGEPLLPFGYGLSYTTFEYSDLKVENNKKAGETVKVSATVTNTGKLTGDEVVQLYLSTPEENYPTPIRSLKGFKRVHLNPGEKTIVEFSLPKEAFYVVDENFERVVLPGIYSVSVGGGQPDVKMTTSNILKGRIELLK